MSYKEGFRKRVSHAEINKNHFPYLTFELHILLRTILTAILDVFWAKMEIFLLQVFVFLLPKWRYYTQKSDFLRQKTDFLWKIV